MRSATSLPILAKSIDDIGSAPESATLVGHLDDCFRSSAAIVDAVGVEMLQAFGIDEKIWFSRLSKVSGLAAALHDIGKANNHFQKAVWKLAGKDERQPIRHEWISVWIAMQPGVKKWLMPAVDDCEKCWLIAMCAVAGHHPKYKRFAPTDECFAKSEKDISVLVEHEDFQTCLEQFQNWFGLAAPPEIQPLVYSGPGDSDGKNRFHTMISKLCGLWSPLKKDPEWKRFCAIAKASLIAADVAGSALWEKIDTPEKRSEWLKSSLIRMPTKSDLDEIVDARLGDDKPREFQETIANSSASVTLIEAGCGSGKTVAAYMWAARQHAGRRLWFCYPTTGTATEGFKGYLFGKFEGEDEIRTDLFHSRKEYDLQVMQESRTKEDCDPADAVVRVESLHAWDTQIVNCTVDNVLFLMQNQRRGLYAWPALATSVIVFDEIHCYDDLLFGNLLAWLENLVGIPVLLMTASLPKSKRDAIEEACEFAGRGPVNHVPGPPKLEKLPRYQHATDLPLESPKECVDAVVNEIANGRRVLWISNTVDRTRSVGEVVFAEQVDEPIYYHSRFVYEDRNKRHREVVKLFDSDAAPGFASTSQVAEMSLDLAHATLLVTELAPIPAMIQRLGRLNRRANPDADPQVICKFIVLDLFKNDDVTTLPYDEAELELAREWLTRLGPNPVSQADLIRHWHELDESEEIVPEKSGWLEGGIDTLVDSIRESSHGITVIYKKHLPLAKKEGTAKYALPMNRPPHENWKAQEHPFRGFPIASDQAIDYDEKKGASWASHNIF